ncbi:RHO protein GDP dissociation inhibitor [Pelagophyceae sp. CCMP2097]|nr:RHO protein GDP dissociation inhibitor [Pelagophyceae sp. CCMP2097]|mmetsp:Transcript_15459/g.52138  ORF Transcript_15459/g.52138 Transcript_15459/m.52138 type:complete len:193 (+) Transcript_15459:16-594(+)
MAEFAPTAAPGAPKGSGNIADLMLADAGDESLRRYKEQLLGAAAKGDLGDVSDPRKVIVTEFRILFNGAAPDLVFSLDNAAGMMLLSRNGMSIKEGVEYKFRISFKVQHEILAGLRFLNKTKKMGFSNTDEIMIGSYPPQSKPHVFEFPRDDWLVAPKGMMYRGTYTSTDKFVDSDGKTHLEYTYPLKVVGK